MNYQRRMEVSCYSLCEVVGLVGVPLYDQTLRGTFFGQSGWSAPWPLASQEVFKCLERCEKK